MLLKCVWLRGEETHHIQRFGVIFKANIII